MWAVGRSVDGSVVWVDDRGMSRGCAMGESRHEVFVMGLFVGKMSNECE